MKKKDFLHYLDQRLTEKMSDHDIALDWDTKNHTIEIILRFYAENHENLPIDDLAGVSSEEDIIEFEDSVLLANKQKSSYQPADYLAVLFFEGKKGFSKGYINGLVDYLAEIMNQGMSDLLDFLEDDSDEAVFELKWKPQLLEEYLESYKAELNEYLPYPSY